MQGIVSAFNIAGHWKRRTCSAIKTSKVQQQPPPMVPHISDPLNNACNKACNMSNSEAEVWHSLICTLCWHELTTPHLHNLIVRLEADGQLSVITICLQCLELLKTSLAKPVLASPLPILRAPAFNVQQPLHLPKLQLMLQRHTQNCQFMCNECVMCIACQVQTHALRPLQG